MGPMHDYIRGKAGIAAMPPGCIFSDFPVTYTCGGAGLASTIEDYMHFAQMLAQRGCFGGKQLLREESVCEMVKGQMPGGGAEMWGYGVRVVTKGADSYLSEGAFGWSGAYGTHFWVDPMYGLVALYFKNSLYDGGSQASTARDYEKDVYSSLEDFIKLNDNELCIW